MTREADVLRLVTLGLSDQDVAHVRLIYRKLGASSRAAAGEFAQGNGLL